jgi:6-pyruvoyltetrahydropterin/6-carboxytetrahydropterin synthase
MTIRAVRYHDFSCGHRVVGHEGKCRYFHGHNYRVTFAVEGKELDDVGRVIDFSVIKSHLCGWLEDNWDHKFLAWDQDPIINAFCEDHLEELGIVKVPFNPTAENMGLHLIRNIAPEILGGAGVALVKVIVEETRKCSAEVSL